MKTKTSMTLAALALLPALGFGLQEAPTFEAAADTMKAKLEASMAELDALRQQIIDEKVPLTKELSALETELVGVRAEFQQVSRTLDGRTLDLSNMRTEIKQREDEVAYLSGLFGDYIRSFESRLHIAEVQRYEEELEAAKAAPGAPDLTESEVFAIQAQVLATSLDRLHEGLGGTQFDGVAVNPNGLVKKGSFALVGPVALFTAGDGLPAGTVEQKLGSLEPTQIVFANPEDAKAAENLIITRAGVLPLDATLGNAHKMADADVTFLEEFEKGGNVMYAIFALAGLALLVALYKFVALMFVRKPSQVRVQALLDEVQSGDEEGIRQTLSLIKGPAGQMLHEGVEHLREPRELIEEVMYETVLTTRLKLERLLSFIAVCAASAPLLGLLGTVTGIISTFKLITVFGSGDVKMLSGGISEALITTKYGLVVAIPSLLIHAFLARKVRGIIGHMEKTAVAFANAVSMSPGRREPSFERAAVEAVHEPKPTRGDSENVRTQVKEILTDMLTPKVQEGSEEERGPVGVAR